MLLEEKQRRRLERALQKLSASQTGISILGSAITFVADGGLQIKDFSGHKRDGVVQTYISHLEGMTRIQAEAVAYTNTII